MKWYTNKICKHYNINMYKLITNSWVSSSKNSTWNKNLPPMNKFAQHIIIELIS